MMRTHKKSIDKSNPDATVCTSSPDKIDKSILDSIPDELLLLILYCIDIDEIKKLVEDYGSSIKEDLKFQLRIPKEARPIELNIFSIGHTKFDIKEFESLLKSKIKSKLLLRYIELTPSETEEIKPIVREL